MRAAIVVALLLTACTVRSDDGAIPDDAQMIECALEGAAVFSSDCYVEYIEAGDETVVVVRHADGGFRRFTLLDDGHGLEAADGADAANIAIAGEGIEVSIDGDRYRLPANINGADGGA